ncbi:hypothetical protein BDV96DRAFT_594614 [Lophiotrema nucula]|uniref:Uncharacterized protein n=1 Tax=Lophiotrema nucula TaxID=690887 RepID=A0A6A5ZRB9_9PLEO|nr:hypothetical protein BDV96DRAFT_594614 [Lophiotrema nucula]
MGCVCKRDGQQAACGARSSSCWPVPHVPSIHILGVKDPCHAPVTQQRFHVEHSPQRRWIVGAASLNGCSVDALQGARRGLGPQSKRILVDRCHPNIAPAICARLKRRPLYRCRLDMYPFVPTNHHGSMRPRGHPHLGDQETTSIVIGVDPLTSVRLPAKRPADGTGPSCLRLPPPSVVPRVRAPALEQQHRASPLIRDAAIQQGRCPPLLPVILHPS